jgi:hypothetical protein
MDAGTDHIYKKLVAPPVPSNEIVSDWLHPGIYSQVTATCQHMDVRVLLMGIKDPFLSTVHTTKQIELVIFDCVLDEVEADNFLKPCLLNATQKCQIVTITGNEDSSSDNVFIHITGTVLVPKSLNHSALIECYKIKN